MRMKIQHKKMKIQKKLKLSRKMKEITATKSAPKLDKWQIEASQSETIN